MRIGLGLGITGTGSAGEPPIITATSAPTMAALDDSQTPSDGFTAGSYQSSEGTISSAVVAYLVNGSPQAGTFDLTAGDVVSATETVTDSAANERVFSTGSVVVTPSVALANSAAPVVSGSAVAGNTLTTTDGTWTGSASRTYSYQWTRDGSPISGETGSTYTSATGDIGSAIGCTVTADDGFTQVSTASNTVTITAEAEVDAILLSIGGQSNARTAGNSGNTPPAKYTTGTPLGDTWIWVDGSSAFAAYDIGVNSGHQGTLDSGVWGSEAEFVYQLRQAGDTRPVYIVKECTNGQALAQVGGGDWSPLSSGERYDGYVAQATAARANLDGASTTYEQVMLWCQGEADTNTVNQPADDNYGTNLVDLLTNLDSDSAFDAAGTWIIERIRPYTDADKPLNGAFKVREAQETVAAENANVRIVSLDFDPANFTSLHPVEPWTEGKGLRCYAAYDGTYDATYGAISDATPSNLNFTDQTDVATSTVITSNQIAIAGIGGHSDITITGGEYRVLNSDATTWQDWTSAAGTIHPFQTIQLRQTSSGSVSTRTDVTVTVGGVSDTWSVTTFASAPSYEAETDAFIAQVSSNGGGTIAGADADALDAFYVAAKATTWWAKLVRLYLRLGDEVASSLDLSDQATSLTKVNPSGLPYVWSAAAGFSPQENSNTGLDLKVNPSTDLPQNDCSVGVFYSAFSSDTRGEINGGGEIFMRNTSAGACRYLLNSSGNTNASGLGTTAGLRAISRTGASALALHGIDGSIINTSTNASVAPTGTGLCLGNAVVGNLTGGIHSADASFFGAFAADSALTEAEMQSLATIAGDLLTAFAP